MVILNRTLDLLNSILLSLLIKATVTMIWSSTVSLINILVFSLQMGFHYLITLCSSTKSIHNNQYFSCNIITYLFFFLTLQPLSRTVCSGTPKVSREAPPPALPEVRPNSCPPSPPEGAALYLTSPPAKREDTVTPPAVWV